MTDPDDRVQPLGNATTPNRFEDRHVLSAEAAAILRCQRQALGRSLRDIASEIGISAPFLSRLERGLRAPGAIVAHKLTKALALSEAEAFLVESEAVFGTGYDRKPAKC